ncbi:MAG: hypothetical protein Q7J65_08555 [Candidatus Marinimicrobia bacterium]|nr:hypothetical protein [Candidatus Neomarinimicrobiota bacterium]
MAENQTNKSNFITGFLLILLGIFLLSAQFGYICWGNLWPFFLIIGGVLFFLGFLLNRRNYGLLMPGSVLTVIGLLFLYTNAGRWYEMENFWPTFVLAPGIGFVLMFLFGPKGNALWIPAAILCTIALVFYARFWRIFQYWPIVLILIGLYIIFSGIWGKDSKGPEDPVDFTGE